MLEAEVRHFKKAFIYHRQIAIQGGKLMDNSHQIDDALDAYYLLLFYAVESGLKFIIKDKIEKNIIAWNNDLDKRMKSHDLVWLAGYINDNLKLTQFPQLHEDQSFQIKNLHERLRYQINSSFQWKDQTSKLYIEQKKRQINWLLLVDSVLYDMITKLRK
jgi:hypothetical protein